MITVTYYAGCKVIDTTKIAIVVGSYAEDQPPLAAILQSLELYLPQQVKERVYTCIIGANYAHTHGRRIHVTDSSADYSGMIWFTQEYEGDATHVIFLRDSMVIGEHFFDLLCTADPDVEATAAINGVYNNIVLYRTDYLRRNWEFIENQRNRPSVLSAGALWQDSNNRRSYPGEVIIDVNPWFPYAHTTHNLPYTREYYTGLDLYHYVLRFNLDEI